MTTRRRAVTVMQLPERVNLKEGRSFLREMESCMHADRPYLVLDCSSVRQLDKSLVHLLLRCLEEAMKRNGDVKLAGISLTADVIPEFAAANRLFEVFETTADAVDSFHQLPFEADSVTGESESAA